MRNSLGSRPHSAATRCIGLVWVAFCACGAAEQSSGDAMVTTGAAGSNASAADGSGVHDAERDAVGLDAYAPNRDVATDEAIDSGAAASAIDSGREIRSDVGALGEGCEAVDPGDQDFDHATPYRWGERRKGCVHDANDFDFYEFTTPSTSAGGYVVVALTEVGAATMNAAVFAGDDRSQILALHAARSGADLWLWYAAAPATKFRLSLSDLFRTTAFRAAYTLTITHTAVEDPFEPNDVGASATPLQVGMPVRATLFSGYSRHDFPGDEWADWFRVSVEARPVTVLVTNVPRELRMSAYLYDSGVSLNPIQGYGTSVSDGASVSFTTPPLAAGEYKIRLYPNTSPDAFGLGAVPASYVTQSYELTVTN